MTSAARHAQGIDEWKTPSPLRKIERKGESNLTDRSKKTTKSLTPIGRVDPNGFAALLGTDVDEEDLAGVGSGNASVDEEDLAGVGSGKASTDDAAPSSTTPSARSALPVQRTLPARDKPSSALSRAPWRRPSRPRRAPASASASSARRQSCCASSSAWRSVSAARPLLCRRTALAASPSSSSRCSCPMREAIELEIGSKDALTRV